MDVFEVNFNANLNALDATWTDLSIIQGSNAHLKQCLLRNLLINIIFSHLPTSLYTYCHSHFLIVF